MSRCVLGRSIKVENTALTPTIGGLGDTNVACVFPLLELRRPLHARRPPGATLTFASHGLGHFAWLHIFRNSVVYKAVPVVSEISRRSRQMPSSLAPRAARVLPCEYVAVVRVLLVVFEHKRVVAALSKQRLTAHALLALDNHGDGIKPDPINRLQDHVLLLSETIGPPG